MASPQLSGARLGACENLTYLDASHNRFGHLTSGVCRLTKLPKLVLGATSLRRSCPPRDLSCKCKHPQTLSVLGMAKDGEPGAGPPEPEGSQGEVTGEAAGAAWSGPGDKAPAAEADGTAEAMERLKALMKDPKFIERGITALDKMMAHVSQSRHNAVHAVEDAKEACKWLDQEIDQYQPKLDLLHSELEEKKKKRDAVEAEIGRSKNSVSDIMKESSAIMRNIMSKDRALAKKMASFSVSQARNYDTKITTTEYVRQGRKGGGSKK